MLPFLVCLGLGGLGFLAYRAVTRAPGAEDPTAPAFTASSTSSTSATPTTKVPASRYEATSDVRALHGVPDEQDRLVDDILPDSGYDPNDTSGKEFYDQGYADGYADYPGHDRWNAYQKVHITTTYFYEQGYNDGRLRAELLAETDYGHTLEEALDPDNLDVLG